MSDDRPEDEIRGTISVHKTHEYDKPLGDLVTVKYPEQNIISMDRPTILDLAGEHAHLIRDKLAEELEEIRKRAADNATVKLHTVLTIEAGKSNYVSKCCREEITQIPQNPHRGQKVFWVCTECDSTCSPIKRSDLMGNEPAGYSAKELAEKVSKRIDGWSAREVEHAIIETVGQGKFYADKEEEDEV